MARPGRRGTSRRVKVRHGVVYLRMWPGVARRVTARQGGAWRGKVSFLKDTEMRKMKAAELIEDFDLYPRNNVDSHNVRNLVNALASGAELPPIICDRKSKRVTDGFHRRRAYLQFYGEDAEIMVIEKNYRDEAAMFLDAMRMNAGHGAKLDPCDRTHCVIIAERLSIPLDQVAGALQMPIDKLGPLRQSIGTDGAGLSIPLKRTISKGFGGRKLNKRQVEANTKLSGMSQQFYFNQCIELLEAGLLDKSDDKLIERCKVLFELLETLLVAN